jgi:outer membrane protein
MKKFIIYLFFSFFIFFNAFGNEKVAYIDIDRILNESLLGKSFIDELKKISLENNKKIQSQKEEILKQETEIKKLKNVISDKDFQIKVNTLKNNVNNFNANKKNFEQNFNKKRQEMFANLMKKISPIVETYMSQNSISIVMDKKNVFIAKSNYDITKNIIDLINK